MATLWRVLVILVVGALVASCGGGDSTTGGTGDQPSAPTLVNWNRDPLTVVFRADVVGGDRTLTQLNNYVPECTIYGDGRVVWRVDNANGDLEVLFDFLDDQIIANFVDFLVVQQRIYTHNEGYLEQVPQSVVPVYQQVILDVNNVKHITDSFADWQDGFYQDSLTRCQTLSATPRQFAPSGAWISAVTADPNRNLPTVFWDTNATGYAFNDLALEGTKRWVEGRTITFLWENLIVAPGDVQFNDGYGLYDVSFQVPGVTLDAPAAPAQ